MGFSISSVRWIYVSTQLRHFLVLFFSTFNCVKWTLIYFDWFYLQPIGWNSVVKTNPLKMIASGRCSKECSQCWLKVTFSAQCHDKIDKLNGNFWFHSTGIPELGIEHFEPLNLQSVSVSRGSGSLTLAGGFKNLIVKGPSNTTVSRAK